MNFSGTVDGASAAHVVLVQNVVLLVILQLLSAGHPFSVSVRVQIYHIEARLKFGFLELLCLILGRSLISLRIESEVQIQLFVQFDFPQMLHLILILVELVDSKGWIPARVQKALLSS